MTPLVSEELFDAVAGRLCREPTEKPRKKDVGQAVCARNPSMRELRLRMHGTTIGEDSAGVRERGVFLLPCAAKDRCPTGDKSRCRGRSIRIALLDEAIWRDVRELLRDPDRVKREYERRLATEDPHESRASKDGQKALDDVKRGIGRLIDAYENGLLSKEEFEPRIQSRKERLAYLEKEAVSLAAVRRTATQLGGRSANFRCISQQISAGLDRADFTTKREIIRALVKRIEIGQDDVRVVYRISPSPFRAGPR